MTDFPLKSPIDSIVGIRRFRGVLIRSTYVVLVANRLDCRHFVVLGWTKKSEEVWGWYYPVDDDPSRWRAKLTMATARSPRIDRRPALWWRRFIHGDTPHTHTGTQ